MKSFLINILFITGIAALHSCGKNFLDVPDKTVLLKEAYVVDLKTANDYLKGCYVTLAYYFADGQYFQYGDLIADNIKPFSGYMGNIYTWSLGNAGGIETLWTQGYRIIRDCNYIIGKVDELAGENPAKARAMKGEALALRAYMHLMIANIFAQSYSFTANGTHPGIPYITSAAHESKITRQTVAEVYSAITEDINKALELLPASSIDRLAMNYQSAKALLARISLCKYEYAKAKELSLQVLAAVPITITDYPAALYSPKETEALFQVSPADYSTNTFSTSFMGEYTRTYQAFYASNDIAALLTQNPDDRRKGWVTKVAGSNDWLITKFPEGVCGGLAYSPPGDHYTNWFRSSEMCLTAAETYAQLGKEDSARYYLDQIRMRAIPTATASTETGQALLEKIYTERRKEMAFDGLRMFDLLRWKKGVHRSDGPVGATNLPYPSYHAICPIPLSEVQLSGLEQNEGYK